VDEAVDEPVQGRDRGAVGRSLAPPDNRSVAPCRQPEQLG
jgi:hypothetical protein